MTMKTNEQREGEAAFFRVVRAALLSLVLLVVFCYWWAAVAVGPVLKEFSHALVGGGR
jgi:hypothetical protein